ncbi:integral membrane protein 2C-like [Alosa pseudoharengus]|uniref:integral membrane protein 2C-like n=1 Tax=Alosa pseudoharengus TaxID=34774 RepID=UPI003F88A509
MVKISFQPVAGQKVEKDEVDGEQPAVLISQPHDQQVPPVMKRSSMATLCCLTSALLVFTCSLLYACVYIYTHYIIPQVPSQSEFRCRVMYDDAVMAPLRSAHVRARPHTHSHTHTHSHSLDEKVDIYLQDNYELISVPVPDFSNTHPAEIIHDFHMGLTAYHDLTLDKCYVSELNASVVMAPRNLWELLINVKRGSYLPQRYLVQEQMSVAARVSDLRPLGPFISRLCSGKDTYRLHRHGDARRVYKRALESCNRIRHFENEFVMETLICEPQ